LEENKDKKAQALDDFNHYVAAHPRVESVILPLRDGIHLIRKK
jgi:predicted O-methyltransferase YrrM